jgi:hypothetical protein
MEELYFDKLPVELNTIIVSYINDMDTLPDILEVIKVDFTHLFLINLRGWYHKNISIYNIKNVYINLYRFSYDDDGFFKYESYEDIITMIDDKETIRYAIDTKLITDEPDVNFLISYIDDADLFLKNIENVENNNYGLYFPALFTYNSYNIFKHILKGNEMLKNHLFNFINIYSDTNRAHLKELFVNRQFSCEEILKTFELLTKYKMIKISTLIESILPAIMSDHKYRSEFIIEEISKILKMTNRWPPEDPKNSEDLLEIKTFAFLDENLSKMKFKIFKIVYDGCKHLLGKSAVKLYKNRLKSISHLGVSVSKDDLKIIALLANNKSCREKYGIESDPENS